MKKLNLRSRVKLTGAMTLLACLFCLVGAVHATEIYDNLTSTSAGVDPLMAQSVPNGFWLGEPLFNSFSTETTDFYLRDVQLLMKRDPGTASSFSVALYNDSSTSPGTPGTLVTTLGTMSDSVLSVDTLSVVDFPIAPYVLLTAETRYWIVLYSPNPSNSSTADWSWSLDETVGVTGEYHGYYAYNNPGYVWPNIGGTYPGPYQMRLSDVPLPGTVWLLGSGLLGLVGRRRFRKN